MIINYQKTQLKKSLILRINKKIINIIMKFIKINFYY